jgi:alkaline phosphatase
MTFGEILVKKSVRYIACLLIILWAWALPFPGAAFGKTGIPKCKNIIFMVPDGMGMAYVTAARIFNNGPKGSPLYLERFEQIGYQRTYSAGSTVTDSAAAASAWASGEKYLNGEVSCHDRDGDGVCNAPLAPTILELAKAKGMAAGLVVTSTISHATPAAWGAHVHCRNCETEIARQYIMETGVDVLLGGGIGGDSILKGCRKPSHLSVKELIHQAREKYGYTFVNTKAQLSAAVTGGAVRLLGLFSPGAKNPETFRVEATDKWNPDEPTLAEMTSAALKALEKDDDGFFLLVEGSQVDWAGHDNDLKYLISEVLGFDAAVEAVQDWVRAEPSRKLDTLLIIAPDHETGGFAINGPVRELSKPGELIEGEWASTHHTAVDTLIWSEGPGSENLGRALDNTDLYHVMREALNGD